MFLPLGVNNFRSKICPINGTQLTEVMLLLSSEHFSLDGTLLRAWTSYSSLERIVFRTMGLRHPVVAMDFSVAL